MWANPAHRFRDKMPDSSSWDTMKHAILRELFNVGQNVIRNMLDQPIALFWGWWMSKEIDRNGAERRRAMQSLEAAVQKTENLLGEDFIAGGEDVAKKFKPKACTSAIRVLRVASGKLRWAILTEDEKESLLQKLDIVDQTSLRAHWDSLTTNAKRTEYVSRALGWMRGMQQMQSKSEKSCPDLELLPEAQAGCTS